MLFTMKDGRQWSVNEKRAVPCFSDGEYFGINTTIMNNDEIQQALQKVTDRLRYDRWSGQYNDPGY